MRAHRAILMLLARSTIYKFLGLLALMGAVEAALFRWALEKQLAAAMGELPERQGSLGLEFVFEQSRVHWVFAAGLLLTSLLLCCVGCEWRGRQGYTLRRLSVSERGVFFWQSAYNTGCYVLLWGFQVFLALLFCAVFVERVELPPSTNQTVFLAFYRSGFLHGLLPLGDVLGWVRNGMLAPGLGMAAALFPYRQRRGKFGGEIVALAAAAILWFPSDLELGDFVGGLVALGCCVVIVEMVIFALGEGEEADETGKA